MSEEIRPIRVNTPVNENLEVYDFLVIDRSGSMLGARDATINGVNTYLKKLKDDQAASGVKTFISIILFDHEILDLYDFAPIQEVGELTQANFVPRGMTALNDAVGTAIEKLKAKLTDKLTSDDVDVTVSVFTDGEENSSTRYPGLRNNALFGLIEELKNTYKWAVTFTGYGTIEQVRHAASNIGIDVSNVQSYSAGHESAAFLNMSSARSVKSRSFTYSGLKSAVGYFTDPGDDGIDNIAIPTFHNTTSAPDHFQNTTIPTNTFIPSYGGFDVGSGSDSSGSSDSGGCDGGCSCGGD